ncbi:MAG: hypothetical protein LBI05_03370, partial [Planctomycetaceae bacterium]|nr:hypothetical protein [Planctomycetaceae bacterium]
PVELSLENLSLKMPGTHQMENAAAAVTAFLLLQKDDSDRSPIRNGLLQSFMPLRCEIVSREDFPTIIFDGAHNRSSMQAFVKTVSEMFPHRQLLLIFGASLGKDVEGMFAEIEGQFSHVFLTQSSQSSRRFPPQELRLLLSLSDTHVSTVENCKDAWEQCMQRAGSTDVICVTGSLYLAAELRQLHRKDSILSPPPLGGGE